MGSVAKEIGRPSALVRADEGHALTDLPGGTSFMEDEHLSPRARRAIRCSVLSMLEICPSIAYGKPRVGNPSARHRRQGRSRAPGLRRPAGPALNASLVDLGNRFRLLINEVNAVKVAEDAQAPSGACAYWECQPDFKTACQAWILAGGAHHTGYSYAVTAEMLEDFATIAGLETVHINTGTTISQLRQDLRNNEVYYHLADGFRH